LDSLGFPWILSSESRLINGLQGTKREIILPCAFPIQFVGNMGVAGRGHAEPPDSP
jgi:hypothetical protein